MKLYSEHILTAEDVNHIVDALEDRIEDFKNMIIQAENEEDSNELEAQIDTMKRLCRLLKQG